MKKFILAAALLVVGLTVTGCDQHGQSSDDRQAQREETQLAQGAAQVGIANITQFTEKALANKILELRDQPHLLTFSYVQGMDGRLICIGHSIGFGLPYAAQTTSSQKLVAEYPRFADGTRPTGNYYSGPMPQAEPNGLFMPDNAEGTWLILIDDDTGLPYVSYWEPRVTVSPKNLHGPAVAIPCSK